jgi:hypothetical protein
MAVMKIALGAVLASLCAAAGSAVAAQTPAPATLSAEAMVNALSRDFPPGSIETRERADQALSAARDAHARLQREFEVQSVHCSDVFFVNRCMDAARHTQRSGERVVRAVTLEAHDLQRRLDGQAHARSQEQALRQQAADDLLRPERERQALASARLREDNAAARDADEKRDIAKAAQDSAAKQAQSQSQQRDLARKDALRPHQESAALQDYRDKQAQAVAYAKTRAQDREANAKRRTEREAARAAAERQDAAQPAK